MLSQLVRTYIFVPLRSTELSYLSVHIPPSVYVSTSCLMFRCLTSSYILCYVRVCRARTSLC